MNLFPIYFYASILGLLLGLFISDRRRGPPSAPSGQLSFEFITDTYRLVKEARRVRSQIRYRRAALKFYRKDPDRTSMRMFWRMMKESRA